MYDKPLNRKTLVKFNPESVLNLMQNKAENDLNEEEDREKIVDDYLEVSIWWIYTALINLLLW